MNFILPIYRRDDPGKHHIDGIRFPIETHLVHQGPSGHLPIIGVLV